MLGKCRPLLVSFSVIVASAAISYAVSARIPGGALPAGTTRYAAAVNETTLNRSKIDTWESTLLSTPVTIPTGKTADVMVRFCSVTRAGGDTISVRARIGNALLAPSGSGAGVPLYQYSGDMLTQCVDFYKTVVGQGTQAVKVEWRVASVNAHLYARTMIVTLNIH